MKKAALFLAVLVLTASVAGVSAFAAGRGPGRNFVDADGDGICDNCGVYACSQNFVDADGDGICDNCGSGGGCQNRWGRNR